MVRRQLDEQPWASVDAVLGSKRGPGRPPKDNRNFLQDCVPVIPSNGSRATKLPYDKELYKARSEVECTFNLLKQARRFATRYEKTLRNYASLGCALLWLRI